MIKRINAEDKREPAKPSQQRLSQIGQSGNFQHGKHQPNYRSTKTAMVWNDESFQICEKNETEQNN